jgi:serine/threonine protein kinase
MSDNLKDIITKLLDKDAEKRLGSKNDADEIVNHPWFKDIEWEGLMNKTLESPFKPDMEKMVAQRADTLSHINKDKNGDQEKTTPFKKKTDN